MSKLLYFQIQNLSWIFLNIEKYKIIDRIGSAHSFFIKQYRNGQRQQIHRTYSEHCIFNTNFEFCIFNADIQTLYNFIYRNII